LGALAGVAFQSVFIVDAGHRAVIFDRFTGIQPKVRGEGMHFKIPFIQQPTIYDTRTRYTNVQSETGTQDLQSVSVTLRLLYSPDIDYLPTIHKELGPDYDEKVLPSITNQTLKSVVAKNDAEQLISQRELVSTKVRQDLTDLATKFHIVLDDVSITHVSFSSEYTTAIESKQVAHQDAERSKFIVDKARQDKIAAVTKADGEAKAAKLITEAIKGGTGFIELRKIEALREIAETLSKSRNITFFPGGSNVLMNLDTKSNQQQQEK